MVEEPYLPRGKLRELRFSSLLAFLAVALIFRRRSRGWLGAPVSQRASGHLACPVRRRVLFVGHPRGRTDTIPGVRANVAVQSLVVTRIMDFWGRTGGLSVVLPYAFIDTSAGPFRTSTNGASDLGFLFQMNIFGGPALTREQFQSFIPQTFSSFHLLVTTPIGTYDATSPINPSANRWMVSPTVNFSYTPDQGWTWIETYVTGAVILRQQQLSR